MTKKTNRPSQDRLPREDSERDHERVPRLARPRGFDGCAQTVDIFRLGARIHDLAWRDDQTATVELLPRVLDLPRHLVRRAIPDIAMSPLIAGASYCGGSMGYR